MPKTKVAPEPVDLEGKEPQKENITKNKEPCLKRCERSLKRCRHFLYHKDEFGVALCCGNTFLNWFQIKVALLLLWALTTLFWWLMFELVVSGKIIMLWLFGGACAIYTGLWVILLAQGKKEYNLQKQAEAEEEKKAKELYNKTDVTQEPEEEP